MSDVFANITSVPEEMVETVANVLEMRAKIPSQQAMLHDYLSEIEFPSNAEVLEIGCGTGPVCRVLGSWPNIGNVTGVDPSSTFIEKAKKLAGESSNIHFAVGDGKNLEFDDHTFDVVIIHTLLTHVPEPKAVLKEAYRILKPGGSLGLCDGDFSTATLSTAHGDPLEACMAAFVENFVHDKWLVRRMSSLAEEVGFIVNPVRSYGLIETRSPGLTMSWVDRGADALLSQGRIGEELADALKSEGRRRADTGTFFGFMAYAALTATKSA